MTDDRTQLEVRLHDAFRHAALPPAPPSLMEALERVAETAASRPAVTSGPRLVSRPPWSLVGIAAVATLGLVWQLFSLAGGTPTVTPPAPSSPPPIVATYRVVFDPGVQPDPALIDRTAEILRERIDALRITGATVTTGAETIMVSFPDRVTAEESHGTVAVRGSITFVPVPDDVTVEPGDAIDLRGTPALFDSASVSGAEMDVDQLGQPVLNIHLVPSAAALFRDYTRTHVGSAFAMAIDGVAFVVPRIQSEIPSGEVQISTGANDSAASSLPRLAAIIRGGPLPVSLVEMDLATGPPPAPTPALAPSAQPSVSASPWPSELAAITTCDQLPPRTGGLFLSCQAAVLSAITVFPSGVPTPTAIDFVHTCFSPDPNVLVDCYVEAFGIVSFTFEGGSVTRVGVSVGSSPVILRDRATPAPS